MGLSNFNCVLEYFPDSSSSSDDEENNTNMYLVKRILRNKSNPLELPSVSFIQAFRVDKELFRFILDRLELIEGIYSNSTHITPAQQLALALNFLGGGGYQHQMGRDFNAPDSQGKISMILKSVLNKLEEKLCPAFIKFELKEETKRYYFEKFRIPGVIGCVDGTHIMMLKPSENEQMFYNRKGIHSINAMVICNEKYEIVAINPRFGGAAHDSFVWRQSNERRMLEEKLTNTRLNCWLLGDSGYPLEPFLMTPYRSAGERTAEAVFNSKHSKARSTVERCIGVLKTRWRVILEERKCRYSPEKVGQIINICAALHNLCVGRNVILPEAVITEETAENIPVIDYTNITRSEARREAERIRDSIRDSLV